MKRADHFEDAVRTLRAHPLRLFLARWFGATRLEYDEALDRVVVIRVFRGVRYMV